MRKTKPIGKDGSWKTGQRTPESGLYTDQYGSPTYFYEAGTFPPVRGTSHRECGWFKLIRRKGA